MFGAIDKHRIAQIGLCDITFSGERNIITNKSFKLFLLCWGDIQNWPVIFGRDLCVISTCILPQIFSDRFYCHKFYCSDSVITLQKKNTDTYKNAMIALRCVCLKKKKFEDFIQILHEKTITNNMTKQWMKRTISTNTCLLCIQNVRLQHAWYDDDDSQKLDHMLKGCIYLYRVCISA